MRKFLLLITFLLPNFSQAQSQKQALKDWNFSIGPGFIFKNNLYKNNQYSFYDKKIVLKPVPFFHGKYSRFSLGARGISARMYGDLFKNIDLNLGYFSDRYKSEDINKRYSSLTFGASAYYNGFSFEYRHDIQARSQGSNIKIAYTKMFPLTEKIILLGSVGLEWLDDRYADYYFSIKNGQSQARFKNYKSKNYFLPNIGVIPIYKINEHFSGTIGGNLRYYPQKVTRSPIMNGKQLEYSAIFGLSYNM